MMVSTENGPSKTMSNVSVPTPPGKAGTILTFTIHDQRRAIVKPYPFAVDPLNVSFPGRLIPKRYRSQNDFLEEYYGAERFGINY